MTEEYLSNLLANMTRFEQARWYEQQILVARYLRNGLAQLGKLDATSSMLPDAAEIVSETLLRIKAGRFIWDGKSPPTFNKFLAASMKTTLNSLRSRERRFAISNDMRSNLQPLADDDISRFQEAGATLAGVIIRNTRMRGQSLEYVKRLDHYATIRASTEDIADDLGVEPSTVESYRKRIRSVIKK